MVSPQFGPLSVSLPRLKVPQRLKILHIAAGNLFGGVEAMLLTLALYQDSCPNLDQHFAVCFDGRLATELEATGRVVHRLGAVRTSRPWTVIAAQRALRSLLDKGSFDWAICHSAWPLGLLGPAVRGTSTQLAVWMHDAARGKHWVERLAKRTRPDFAICNSRYTATSLPTLFRDLPHEVLYCPVPPPRTPQPGQRKVLREQLGTVENDFVILIAARFEGWKGHPVLIDALSRLNDIPSWHVWIAGGAQRPHEVRYLTALKKEVEKIQQSSRIQFLGQRNDVPELMAAANLYCQPNTSPEPFGISFVEALYAGLPVVTSAFGGALEIVTPAYGSLLPPGDPLALAHELRLILNDKKRVHDASIHGPQRAAELCDPSRQVEALHNILFAQRAV